MIQLTLKVWLIILASILVTVAVVLGITLPLVLKRDGEGESSTIPNPFHNMTSIGALKTRIANGQFTRIFTVGDSTTAGASPDSTDFMGNSWPMQMSGFLPNASSQSFVGFGLGAGPNGPIKDNRLVTENGWSGYNSANMGYFTVGGGLYVNTDGTSKITFTPTKNVDTLEIYLTKTSAPVRVTVGSNNIICDPSTDTTGRPIVKFVLNVTASMAPIQFTAPTATPSTPALLSGMISYNSVSDKVIVINVGAGGATSRGWVDQPSNIYRAMATFDIYKPDAFIVNLCINSYLLSPSGTAPFIGETLADYKTSYRTLLQYLKTQAPTICHTPVISPVNDLSLQNPYVNAAREIFESLELPWYDFNAVCGSVANEVAKGWLIPTDVHPKVAGYRYFASEIIKFFL